MKILKFIFFIGLISFTYSCATENVGIEVKEDLSSEDVKVRRKYTLDQSNSTGWWTWTCKTGDPPKSGSSPTKGGAKDEGKENCAGAANVVIGSPYETLMYDEVQFVEAIIIDVFGNETTHTSDVINENEIFYWMGVEDYQPIEDSRKAIVYLTLMGLYNGGDAVEEIQQIHNLNPEQFELLITRSFTTDSYVDVNEETGELTWLF